MAALQPDRALASSGFYFCPTKGSECVQLCYWDLVDARRKATHDTSREGILAKPLCSSRHAFAPIGAANTYTHELTS